MLGRIWTITLNTPQIRRNFFADLSAQVQDAEALLSQMYVAFWHTLLGSHVRMKRM